MNKLWIYGCSFSTDYTRKFVELEGKTWYEYISEHFNLEIENHAQNGHGVLSTITNIIKTQSEWDVNDLVIIEIPDPFRIDIPQLNEVILIGELRTDTGDKIKSINQFLKQEGTDFVENQSIDMWNGFVNLLKTHTNKNIYTWFIHHFDEYSKSVNKLNPIYDGSVMDWINKNKTYINEEDKHFSPRGAEMFFREILPKLNYNG